MAELERLARRTVPHAAAARALAERLPGVDSSGRGDDAVIGTATRLGAWVVTSDDELQHRLRDLGVTVLAPRDRHRLELAPGRPAKLGNR
jgi:rRNA-processing protein FCF1